jgi:hypothetical protein
MLRSKTRFLTTVTGCAIGALVICFFLAATHSLGTMKQDARKQANLVITQQDRF